jgi:hypothetical protein
MATVMGMNLSNKFMSTRIPLASAAKQIHGLGISFVKLFDWDAVDRALIDYATSLPASSPIRIALGIPNHRLTDLTDPNGAKKVWGEIERACSYGE